MNVRITTFLAIFTTVILFSLYQANGQRNVFAKIPQQEYMKDLVVTHYTDTGAIKDQIKAKYWAYLPEKELSTLEQPSLLLFKPNGAEWTVTANDAIAYHKTLDSKISKLDLQKNVQIVRAPTNDFVPVNMHTAQVYYFPDTELVETDKFVEMHKPGVTITGVGLKSDLQKNVVTLLDQVATKYEKIPL